MNLLLARSAASICIFFVSILITCVPSFNAILKQHVNIWIVFSGGMSLSVCLLQLGPGVRRQFKSVDSKYGYPLSDLLIGVSLFFCLFATTILKKLLLSDAKSAKSRKEGEMNLPFEIISNDYVGLDKETDTELMAGYDDGDAMITGHNHINHPIDLDEIQNRGVVSTEVPAENRDLKLNEIAQALNSHLNHITTTNADDSNVYRKAAENLIPNIRINKIRNKIIDKNVNKITNENRMTFNELAAYENVNKITREIRNLIINEKKIGNNLIDTFNSNSQSTEQREQKEERCKFLIIIIFRRLIEGFALSQISTASNAIKISVAILALEICLASSFQINCKSSRSKAVTGINKVADDQINVDNNQAFNIKTGKKINDDLKKFTSAKMAASCKTSTSEKMVADGRITNHVKIMADTKTVTFVEIVALASIVPASAVLAACCDHLARHVLYALLGCLATGGLFHTLFFQILLPNLGEADQGGIMNMLLVALGFIGSIIFDLF